MEIAFSLGSNLGDRLALLSRAAEAIAAYGDTQETARSRAYETEPVGVKPEYAHLAYLNTVLVVETTASPGDWLERLGEVEKELGRVRGDDRFAPRTIDVDMLYAGEHCIDSGGLQVPHPRWMKRRFVLAPLADCRPDRILPGQDRTVQEILNALPAGEDAVVLADKW